MRQRADSRATPVGGLARSRGSGTRLDKYTVLRPLATGGMAELHLARVRASERLVVLKLLHPRLAIEREYVQMFHDEAVIASTLHHPNLVEVYELGEDDEPYIAMEYLHGHDLNHTLRRMAQRRVPLTLEHAVTIARDVAAGLHHAHERIGDDGALLNIVHRDVSPHNVFLTYQGVVKVVDFGIAKATSAVGRTRTGVLKGKVAYMSPEQAMVEPLDRRSDIFCIGILLWEMTTGRWLYRRKSELETLKALVDNDAPLPSTLRPAYPKDLEAIVMKTLARAPADRWATAGELCRELEGLARRWRFKPAPAMLKKLMASVFSDEIGAWERVRETGVSLAAHLVAASAEVVELSTELSDSELRTPAGEWIEEATWTDEATRVLAPPRPRAASLVQAIAPWWWRHRTMIITALVAITVACIIACIALIAART